MTEILLLGATGGTGKNILRLLVQNSNYSIKLLVRDIERAKKTLTSEYSSITEDDLKKIKLIQGSITESNLSSEIFDVDLIIHTAATHGRDSKQTEYEVAYEGMKNIIKHSKQSKKLKKIIYVTSGFVTRPFHPVALILNTIARNSLKWKLEAENVLRESGIPYVICRPAGGLSDETLDAPIEFGVGDKISGTPTSRVSVAECVIKCIELDMNNITFEMINNPKKEKTDWKEMTSLSKDTEITIKRNHDLPFYLIYTITIGAIGFMVKKYFF